MESTIVELITTNGTIYNIVANNLVSVLLLGAILFRQKKIFQKIESLSKENEETKERLNSHRIEYTAFKARTETHQNYNASK